MERYTEYKDSGVQWLGKIPSHWDCMKLKALCQMYGRIGFRGYSKDDLVDEGKGAITLGPSNFVDGELNFDKCSYLSWQKYYESPEIMVNNGDIVFVKTASVGKVAIARSLPQETTVNPQILVFKRIACNPFFLNYFLQSSKLQGWVIASANGSTILTISQVTIGDYPIFVPSKAEQDAIVRYLDAATAKIDTAIAKQQQMIDLLNERKQIIINNAVTKGLDSSVKMKDSGVDWIGQIPEHWEINKFRNLFKTRTGISFTKAQLEESGDPVISYGQIHSKFNWGASVNPELIRHIPSTITKDKDGALAFKGDFLFADTSEDFEGCGNCVCVDTDEPIYAGSHTILAKKDNDEIDAYLAYLFASSRWRGQVRSMVNGVKVYSVTQTLLRSAVVLLPPRTEQIAIAEYIKKRVVLLNAAVQRCGEKIALLQERKQIIINDVVTGKVKVS